MLRTESATSHVSLPLARRVVATIAVSLMLLTSTNAAAPPFTDYCDRIKQEIQGKKHGFLAGNVTYYVGGFHASWKLIEHETIGLTHPFHHDLRSRGVGLLASRGTGADNTGTGNDFSGWEFYKDTRVLYGSVVVDGEVHPTPVPTRMYWRPDRMICEYMVGDVAIREQKFIANNDAACTMISASRPVVLRFEGQSFFGRHSVASSATIGFNADSNAICITEGGTTRSRPDTDRSERIGPIMYQGMTTVLMASRSLADRHRFTTGPWGQQQYEFEIDCDTSGTALVWAMHDDASEAIEMASRVVRAPAAALALKTQTVNHELNTEIPWFRCSEKKFEDIYYYLWALYLMYGIDVQSGWEMERHTQTAVNNFLGIHRYDAAFQIRTGSWTADKRKNASGNVLTWKHLFQNGHYRKSDNGTIALSDNKGTTWHSGVYGLELSEHVLGAWQIYQHTGDVEFLRACYEDYFREVFWERIPPFFSDHFEVRAALSKMARLTGHEDDLPHWQAIFAHDAADVRRWFDQRWEAHGHRDYFAGPADGMLMTTGFWHMRARGFPREYAQRMVKSWAMDSDRGFYGDIFPTAMSQLSMRKFASQVDHSFGYTPDTAYFTLSGMFRQRLSDQASRLTVQHLENYNYHPEWGIPVAPEAYTRSKELFGDQYSNFNAGKLLLYLEGLAGIEYSIPQKRFTIRDSMPADWEWMEFRIPLQMSPDAPFSWPVVRVERERKEQAIRKLIRVSDCPLTIAIEPWLEDRDLHSPVTASPPSPQEIKTDISGSKEYRFSSRKRSAEVELQLTDR